MRCLPLFFPHRAAATLNKASTFWVHVFTVVGKPENSDVIRVFAHSSVQTVKNRRSLEGSRVFSAPHLPYNVVSAIRHYIREGDNANIDHNSSNIVSSLRLSRQSWRAARCQWRWGTQRRGFLKAEFTSWRRVSTSSCGWEPASSRSCCLTSSARRASAR